MVLSDKYRKTISLGEGKRLWQLYGFSEPKDLVLEDIAFARGVIVLEGPLEKMEARLLRNGNQGLIRIREDIQEVGRKRFAIAHELGHWELHKDVSQGFVCTDEDLIASYKKSPIEGEANNFAAGLLMPEHLFLEVMSGKILSLDVIGKLADYFNTTLTATALRFLELSDDYCAAIISRAGKIAWWRGSKKFMKRFWITAGNQLSINTIAGSIFSKCHEHKSPAEVCIDAWCEGHADQTGVLIEDSLYMRRYDQVLSLLRLP